MPAPEDPEFSPVAGSRPREANPQRFLRRGCLVRRFEPPRRLASLGVDRRAFPPPSSGLTGSFPPYRRQNDRGRGSFGARPEYAVAVLDQPKLGLPEVLAE